MNTNDERASGEEDLYLTPATIELVTVKRLVYLPQKKKQCKQSDIVV